MRLVLLVAFIAGLQATNSTNATSPAPKRLSRKLACAECSEFINGAVSTTSMEQICQKQRTHQCQLTSGGVGPDRCPADHTWCGSLTEYDMYCVDMKSPAKCSAKIRKKLQSSDYKKNKCSKNKFRRKCKRTCDGYTGFECSELDM